jgi:hypothetical protein
MISRDELDIDLKIDVLLEDGLDGVDKAMALIIEPIGNDDGVTKAFVELMALARVDALEDVAEFRYSAKIAHVRNDCRIKAFKKLTELADKYYLSVFEKEASND